jgi:hypothetical protein
MAISVPRFASDRLGGARFDVLIVDEHAWVKLTHPQVSGFLTYWSRPGADMLEGTDLLRELRDELIERLPALTNRPDSVAWLRASRLRFEGWEYWPANPMPLRDALAALASGSTTTRWVARRWKPRCSS